jgi:hypothetical protein
MAQGHSHLFFRLEVAKKILGSALLIAGTFYGVMGIAWSQVIFGALAFVINTHYSKRYLDYGLIAQTRDFFPVLTVALLMASIVYWSRTQLHLIPALQLTALITLGAIIFIGLAFLFRLTALRDVINLFLRRKNTLPDF